MKFMILKLAVSLLLSMLICGCSPSSSAPLTPQNLLGTFKGSYGGADETFVFRPDGTFTQTLTIANKPLYTNEGQWQIKTNLVQLELRNVYMALDLKGQLQQPPVKMYNLDGLWVSSDQWKRIVFNIDHNYVIDKINSPGGNGKKE